MTQTETRIFHYNLRGYLIAETNQSGQMLAEYVYLGNQLLAMIKPGEAVYYFHNDHLGTPQVLTNDSQVIAWKAVYTPFGGAATSIATVENPFRFPGQYYDPETGLHYNYFRYYNPQTGRYITPDPIGLEGGINLFLYVQANPVNLVDPSGLDVYLDPKMFERWQAQIDFWNEAISNSWLPDFLKQFLYTDMQSQLESSTSCPGMVKIPGSMIAKDWIAKNVAGKVLREFPSQYLNMTIEQIRALAKKGDPVARKAWKLLTSGRFRK